MAGNAAAQSPPWDNTGNGLLKGSYYFREVVYLVADQAGDLQGALALYGQINFDGAGKYSIANATAFDSSVGVPQSFSSTGTYSIGAGGYGFFAHPLSQAGAGLTTFCLVARGILIGSATDNQFNDLFIAAPVPSPAPTNAFFRGSYAMAGIFPGASPSDAADATYQLNPDGQGNLGTVNVQGYFGGTGATKYSQSIPGVKYIFSNAAVNIMFPNSNGTGFYSGNEYLYLSPDANFVFGGSPTGFDMFVGVKSDTDVHFGGIYYQAGLEMNTTPLRPLGYALIDSFYGSFSALGGNIVGHERQYTPVINPQPQGFTYSDTYPDSIVNGTYMNAANTTQYFFGNGGAIRIGFGIGPVLSISVAVRAPDLTGDGVFLNPMGIANAASSAPFTAGISEGEFVVLYGTNLAPGTQVATSLPFPGTLNGVQVTVNGKNAPIYYVSSTQISIIVPYGNPFSIAQIQVINNGVASNVVTQFVNLTTPGLFTLSSNGLGSGAIVHVNGSVVTTDNPARPGETVAMFVTGLGAVSPEVVEGTAGPYDPLSTTQNTLTVYIGGRAATVSYSGLVPSLAGLYQLNVTIPSSTTSGDKTVEILGPDSDAFQASIPVGIATAAASTAP